MLAYEKALDWPELFDLALQQQIGSEELVSSAYRTAGVYSSGSAVSSVTHICNAEDLSGKKRYQEAARVLLDYAQDVREAVVALVQGNLISEARRVVRKCSDTPFTAANGKHLCS